MVVVVIVYGWTVICEWGWSGTPRESEKTEAGVMRNQTDGGQGVGCSDGRVGDVGRDRLGDGGHDERGGKKEGGEGMRRKAELYSSSAWRVCTVHLDLPPLLTVVSLWPVRQQLTSLPPFTRPSPPLHIPSPRRRRFCFLSSLCVLWPLCLCLFLLKATKGGRLSLHEVAGNTRGSAI